MELILTKTAQNLAAVACDGQPSHAFSLPALPDDPVEMGQRLFAALFAEATPACAAWDARPKRILLVTEDPELDALPWEYLHGPDGFVALDIALVRGLPPNKRQPPPDLSGTPLHILAIPSNPIDPAIARLDIEGEWTRLVGGLRGLETAVRLERARPPTLEQTRRLTANQRNRVVHFMGHGGHAGAESRLVFEKENGAPDPVSARDFIRRLEDSAFLVTLNACSSAQAGPSGFANLARALAERGVPYTLGMRAPIPDEDAKAFSQTFYGELARGSSVENALRQARNTLAESQNPWAVGIPVLYTALAAPPGGFVTPAGTPRIDEHQPPLEIAALPRAEGAFQGRVDELLQLGAYLTSGEKVVTIHGPGGQGKTALAHEAAERFAHAWPGGVWAVSLEHAFTLERFTLELVRLLKIDLDGVYKQMAAAHPNQETDAFQGYVQQELERRICHILNRERVLLVLDNAETFTQAIAAKDKSALDLAAFLKEKVLGTQAGLLVTSREHLGWTGEKAIELGGLLPAEGARLFWQSAPGRGREAIGPLAQEISRKVEGHPLSLRLLGGAFDASGVALDEFIHQVEETLLQAEDKYKHEDHRHKTLFASIETSVRYLDDDTRALLSELWIFKAAFQPETAAVIFTFSDLLSETKTKAQVEQISQRLNNLFQRGLLVRTIEVFSDGNWLLYRSLPAIRLFARHYLEQAQPVEALQLQTGKAYAALLQNIHDKLKRGSWASCLATHCREDLEANAIWIEDGKTGWYANRLGWVLQRTGDRQAGLRWLEYGLEIAQGMDQKLELQALNNIASVYGDTGNPGRAMKLYEQTLPIIQAIGDRAGEATILNNIASIYQITGQPDKALALHEQILSIRKEVDDRAGEATTLNNMASVYSATGQPAKALVLHEQVLPIRKEMGDRAGEATTLNNIALVYSATGQHMKALALCEQILPIRQEVGDLVGKANTLNIMASVYGSMGQVVKALALYEQALPIMQDVGDRDGYAAILNNMASVYYNTGNYGKALEFYEQVLPIMQEVGDRIGEAAALNNVGSVYSVAGQPNKALELYAQALPIMQEIGNRAGEAATLNNIALAYSETSQPVKALEMYEQVLPIRKEVGDLAGEATTLNNMALVYSAMGQPMKALDLYDQALSIRKDVGDRAGEASTLNNMANAYCDIGQPDQALALYGQALPIRKEVGDRIGEAATLNNIGRVHSDAGQSEQALALYEQALEIRKEVADQIGEAITLNDMALEYRITHQPVNALALYEQALQIRRKIGDRAGEEAICFDMAMLLQDNNQDSQALDFLRQAVLLEKQIEHPDYAQNAAMLAQWEAMFQRGEPLSHEGQAGNL